MLIKEYRICMPLTVEEYRIAQLYMIQKKSKEESTGQGSGVEIIRNEPYENGPGGSGQYTFKIYHIGSHLPAWFRSILPKSALIVEEEAWNAYPYTKTRYKVPIIEKFTLEIETYYFNDGGDQNNVFNLSEEDQKYRLIDYLDIVNDPITSGDYRKEEDPKLYQSIKTERGPLSDNWISEYKTAQSIDINGIKHIMCAYKLCRVEFKYWGMQTKIEKFIDDIGLRKTMLRAHRQAWCWQDEWFGLSIEDIRHLEEQAAKELAEKMHKAETHDSIDIQSYLTKPSTTTSGENTFMVETLNDPVPEINTNNSAQHNMKSIQTYSFSDDEDESFYDAKSDFQSETDSFMTCRNNFSSNLTLNMDSSTATFSISKSVLLLVVHGGSLLDTNHEYHNKNGDISILRQTFDSVIKASYPHMNQQIAMRLVACPSVVSDLLTTLNKLTPQIIDQQYVPNSSLQYYVPLAAIPLFVTESPTYRKIIEIVQTSLNDRYKEFMRSEEGQHFDGHVSIISDAIGSIFVYDILSKYENDSRLSLTSSSTSQKEVLTMSADTKLIDLDKSHQEIDPISLKSDFIDSSHTFSGLKFKLDFKVHQLFMMGTPIGIIQSFRNITCKSEVWSGILRDSPNETIRHISINESNSVHFRPHCRQIYNLFHLNDPSSYRMEPLINQKFHTIPPMKISNYNRFPHGNDDSVYLIETLFNHPGIVNTLHPDSVHNDSINLDHNSHLTAFLKCSEVKEVINSWWGEKRVDYALHCPDGVQAFPLGALPHLLHASYWESKDCAAFIIRQIIDTSIHQVQDYCNELAADLESIHTTNLSDTILSEKKTKIRSKQSLTFKTMCVPYRINMTANHRGNDVMVLSGKPQILSARFMYGTFDILTPKNEKVDVFIMNLPISNGHWEKEGSEVTDHNGRVQFHITESRRMPEGIYPVRMVLKADSSVVQFHLAVLPQSVEAVIFSIDGSFAASVSISGKDPKVRPGSIDVARFWQDKGYLLIYISARPNMQQRHVQRWLAQHKFPFGMILFSDGVSAEPLKQKLQILAKLIKEVQINVHCSYGSSKDVSVYRSLGLHSHQIFTLGRLSRHKKNISLPLKDGYAAHLNDLLKKDNPLSKPSRSITNVTIRRSCFDVPIKYVSNNRNVDDSNDLSYLG